MARTTIRTEDITASEVTTAKMATDPTNASNLSSGSVPTAQLGNVDTAGLQDDIALLAFKTQANGSLARYNLVDQSVDAFEDATGVDASASTNELRDATSNYYYGGTIPTGGTITSYTDSGTDYTVHSFLANGNFVSGTSGVADTLIVAGGGAGGAYGSTNGGGGGGAGGLLEKTGHSVTAQTYAVVVGAGGTGGGPQGADGADSSWDSMVSDGGGGGGYAGVAGTAGGSGGGAGRDDNASDGGAAATQGDSSGATGYGNRGGDAPSASYQDGGGGGGAGGAGGDGQVQGTATTDDVRGGVGGSGRANALRTGSNVTYAGGGGGASGFGSGGTTDGGGGRGNSRNGGLYQAEIGTANTGGGGGAGQYGDGNSISGKDGGSGIAVIRFIEGALDSVANMTLISNAQTAQSAPTSGDLVMTISNGAGTTTVNTDIKAYISRDGSAYSSEVTLASQGTTGGHTILTAHDVDLSGITSGTSMRWKVTTHNQSASKTTRVQAVSLGWS